MTDSLSQSRAARGTDRLVRHSGPRQYPKPLGSQGDPAAATTAIVESKLTADVGLFLLYPTESMWKDGEREVTCIAVTDDKRTGSLRK